MEKEEERINRGDPPPPARYDLHLVHLTLHIGEKDRKTETSEHLGVWSWRTYEAPAPQPQERIR